jgi:pyridinium-3,5-biscarboxylic acid mononucleotide synthase
MERDDVRRLLRAVRAGKLGVEEALHSLRTLPVDELGFAAVDTHRALRRGFPEAIYGPGKTPQQIVAIMRSLREAGQSVLVTRVGADVFEAVRRVEPRAEHHEIARAIVVRGKRRGALRPGVVVVTAGTADLPVAEEAALAAELMGQKVERIHDVGVAGLHRLMAHVRTLTRASVIVAVAGMEGALPSVIAGMTDCPVIAVPTSTGYGAGAGGQAALLAMLNSCAPGLTVVNIDNGYGAGCSAALINSRRTRR